MRTIVASLRYSAWRLISGRWPAAAARAALLFVLIGPSLGAARPEVSDLLAFTVNSALDQVDVDDGDGLCGTAANICTLRAAVMQANATATGDVWITVPAGTYILTRPAAGKNGAEDGDLNLMPAGMETVIHITGAGAAVTILDANDVDRAFHLASGRVATISGLTVRNGMARKLDEPKGAYGGGILNEGSLALRQCIVGDNRLESGSDVPRGGGIANLGTMSISDSQVVDNAFGDDPKGYGAGIYTAGPLTLTGSVVRDNTRQTGFDWLTVGGGIYVEGEAAVVTIGASTIRDNGADRGGGIVNEGGRVTIVDSVIRANSSFPLGGGIWNRGVMSIRRTAVEGNTALDGGGIANAGKLAFVEGTISHNASYRDDAFGYPGNGGGLINAGELVLVNSTISHNFASTFGGGIYGFEGSIRANNVTIASNEIDAQSLSSGAGIYLKNGTFNGRNILLANNRFKDQGSLDECQGILKLNGHNIVGLAVERAGTAGCTFTGPGQHLPLNSLDTLAPLGSYGGPTLTHALLAGSNAIDLAGSCIDAQGQPLLTDQCGFPRNVGDACDAGAYEFHLQAFVPVVRR